MVLATPTRSFNSQADWGAAPFEDQSDGRLGDYAGARPITGQSSKEADAAHPFRLATSPSRSSQYIVNEKPSSQAREGKPPS